MPRAPRPCDAVRERRPGRRVMGSISGRVLIAGTASLLLCLFLSPKFIEFLRRREFGQNIREEGPAGHKIKAGTPTMGGIIIMIAFAVPFLILSTRDWPSIGVFGGARRVRAARVRRRLHEDRQAPLARAAGADQARGHDRDLARPVVGRDPEGGRVRVDQRPVRRRQRRPRPAVPGADLPRRRRHDQRGEPDRRARRPRRRLLPRSCCWPTSGSRSSPPGRRT